MTTTLPRSRPFPALVWVPILCVAATTGAQAPRIVKDINANGFNPGSDPQWVSEPRIPEFYSAKTPALGRELYFANCAARSTRLILDINPGPGDSLPGRFTRVGRTVFFAADDGRSGYELWKTDGTTQGTVLVKDINPGPNSSYPSPIALGNLLLFVALEPSTGNELYRSDGTAAGTVLIKDIHPGQQSPAIRWMVAMNGVVYFNADDGASGSELWRTDGTSGGTYMVADLTPGSGSSSPDGLYAVGGTLYFWANVPSTGWELHKSDGTTAGTVLVKDIRPGPVGSGRFGSAVGLGNTLLFVADDGSGASYELWRSDGTANGTVLVRDIHPGLRSSNIQDLVVLGAKAYFSATGPALNHSGFDDEVWETDGTTAGTKVAFELNDPFSTRPRDLVVSGNSLYLTGIGPNNQRAAWRSDGTRSGTIELMSSPAGRPYYLTADGAGGIVFSADDGTNGHEPWCSDGTPAGTAMLANLVPGSGTTRSSSPMDLADVGGLVMFSADDGIRGREPWVSDGTAAGTLGIADVRPGQAGSDPAGFTRVADKVFFVADDGISGDELWVLDRAGVRMVHDLVPGSAGSRARPLGALGDRLLFFATTAATGSELFRTDGTGAGTALVMDFVPGTISPNLNGYEFLGDKLLLSIRAFRNSNNHQELWVTDGTKPGTIRLQQTDSRTAGSIFAEPTRVGDVVYFAGHDSGTGWELWRTDGTPQGTRLVKDILPGTSGSTPSDLRRAGNRLFFVTRPGLAHDVWVSDGTANGTRQVTSFNTRSTRALIGAGDLYYFIADDGTHGPEPWRTDGTATGTFMLRDITQGSGGSPIGDTFAIGGRHIHFTVGNDVWTSDGSSQGTVQVSTTSGTFRPIVATRGNIFFRMDDPKLGQELFAIDLPASSQAVGRGCRLGFPGPELSSALPFVGKPLRVQVEDAAVNRQGILFVGLDSWPAYLGGGCTLLLDASGPLLPLFFPTGNGRWSQTLTVPADPTLVGLLLLLQVGVGPTGTPPLGADLSQGLLLKIGR